MKRCKYFMFKSTDNEKVNKNKSKNPIPCSTVRRPLALMVSAFLIFKEPGPNSAVLVSQFLLCQRSSLMFLLTWQKRVVAPGFSIHVATHQRCDLE